MKHELGLDSSINADAARSVVPESMMLGGRKLELRITAAARRALSAQQQPLDVEMELLFSCLVAKHLTFREIPEPQVAARSMLTDSVSVSYRAMLARNCNIGAKTDKVEHETVPLGRPERYVPKWLSLDFRNGEWRGEFGY